MKHKAYKDGVYDCLHHLRHEILNLEYRGIFCKDLLLVIEKEIVEIELNKFDFEEMETLK